MAWVILVSRSIVAEQSSPGGGRSAKAPNPSEVPHGEARPKPRRGGFAFGTYCRQCIRSSRRHIPPKRLGSTRESAVDDAELQVPRTCELRSQRSARFPAPDDDIARDPRPAD